MYNEFVDIDGNLVTAGQRDFAEGDEDMNNKVSDPKCPPTHTQALKALYTIRNYLQINAMSETPFSYLNELEKIVSVIHLQKHKQSSIMD